MSATEKETNQKMLSLIKKELKEITSSLKREEPLPVPSQVIEINVKQPRRATSGSERVREKVHLNEDQYQFIMAFMFFFQLVQSCLCQATEYGAYCYTEAKRLAEPSTLTKSLATIDGIEKGSFRDHAFGCILGAFIGDACGASKSSAAEKLSKDEAEKALKMNGGGVHNIGAGQVTSGSELALCLMTGIVEANQGRDAEQEKVLNIDVIAQQYRKWIDSKPFDQREELQDGWGSLGNATHALRMKKAVSASNQQCQSNSSLMRVMPLAVWASSLRSVQDVKRAVVAEVELSHPNMLV